MNSNVMNLLSQKETPVRYYVLILQFNLLFDGKLNMSKDCNFCFIWSTVDVRINYILINISLIYLIAQATISSIIRSNQNAFTNSENNLVLHNQKYVIVTLLFWKTEPYSFDQITEMRNYDNVLLTSPLDICYRIKRDTLKTLLESFFSSLSFQEHEQYEPGLATL